MNLIQVAAFAVTALLGACASAAGPPRLPPPLSPPPPPISENAPDFILFSANAGPITDSEFGSIAAFQRALGYAARGCEIKLGTSMLRFADGQIGDRTRHVIGEVSRCASFQTLRGTPAEEGAVTRRLWQVMNVGATAPEPLARALMLSHGSEATDYTDVEFNVGTSDTGIMTWGPVGATAGQGHEIQGILREIDASHPVLIDHAFQSEAARIRVFARVRSNDDVWDADAAREVRAVIGDPNRRTLWREGFAALGAQPVVRQIYDRRMTRDRNSYLIERVRNYFQSYWSECWRPTNADLGFFVDRAIQLGSSRNRTDRAVRAVALAEDRLGRTFSPAERRRAMAANDIAGDANHVGDRLARDVIYYVDGIANLDNASLRALRNPGSTPVDPPQLNNELTRWRDRVSRARASHYGLHDAHWAPLPPGIGAPPACIRDA